jgi:hypothetical protein
MQSVLFVDYSFLYSFVLYFFQKRNHGLKKYSVHKGETPHVTTVFITQYYFCPLRIHDSNSGQLPRSHNTASCSKGSSMRTYSDTLTSKGIQPLARIVIRIGSHSVLKTTVDSSTWCWNIASCKLLYLSKATIVANKSRAVDEFGFGAFVTVSPHLKAIFLTPNRIMSVLSSSKVNEEEGRKT